MVIKTDKPIVSIYTDGACSGNPGIGGIGAIITYNNHKKEISKAYKDTTNNRMELRAVIEALNNLKKPCHVKLYTDSKYIYSAFNESWIEKWKKNNWMRNKKEKVKNIDLWKKLIELVEKHDVEFNWIKGHGTDENNNIADKLATSAIKSGPYFEDKVDN